MQLEAEDYAAREAVCHDMLEALENDSLLQDIFFRDEATFHTCGHVDRRNCKITIEEQQMCCRNGNGTPPK